MTDITHLKEQLIDAMTKLDDELLNPVQQN